MKTASLESFDIDPDILDIWQKSGHEDLLPIQEEAVKRGKILDGNNVVIFSPTSSGKTFVGEMAAVRVAQKLRRVIYLAPQKALTEEKYGEFHRKYKEFGIRVVISTRDRKEFDRDIHRGKFHIAVIVFEKMQSLLVANPGLLKNVGLVVIDELQMVGDETRGAGLEILLTKLLLAKHKPQIVGLSAVLGNARELSDWLGATLCESRTRPVELRRGVMLDGTFHYVEQNSGDEGEEIIMEEVSPDIHLLPQYVSALVRNNEQCMVFCKSRRECIETARAIARDLQCPPAQKALEEIDELEDSEGKDILLELLQCGIAYHNSDLDWGQRQIIEHWFRKKDITIICSTTTLAIGINLPSRNVIVDHERWMRDPSGRWTTVGISQAEYENISGRAGRYGQEDQFGRAVLLADTPFNEKSLFSTYVKGDLGAIEPALGKAPLSQHVLNLVASNLCRTRGELHDVLLASYTGKALWQSDQEAFSQRLNTAIIICLEGGLFTEESGILTATPVGKHAAAKGVMVETAVSTVQYLLTHREHALSLDPLEIIWHLTGTADGEEVSFNLSTLETRSGEYSGIISERATHLCTDARERMRQEFENKALTYEMILRLKKTLILYDWITGKSTRDIEKTYHCFSGSIYGLAGEYAWLSEMFVGMAKLLGWSEDAINAIASLPGMMIHGVEADGVKLASLRLRGLARGRISKMVHEGIKTLEHVVKTPQNILNKLIPGKILDRLIRKARQVLEVEDFIDVAVDAVFEDAAADLVDENSVWDDEYPLSDEVGVHYKTNADIEVNGRKDAKRFLVIVGGKECWLRGKSFEAILTLAVAAKTKELGWAEGTSFGTYDGYHQAIKRLKEDLVPCGLNLDELIENSGTKEYRISVPPQRVKVNVETIMLHYPEMSALTSALSGVDVD